MARKSSNGVNVSEAIRTFLKDNPDVGPTAAAEAISKQLGKTVPPSYISNIKSTLGQPKKTGKRGRKPGRAPAAVRASATNGASHGGIDLVTLQTVKSVVDKLGADTAKQLIDLLA